MNRLLRRCFALSVFSTLGSSGGPHNMQAERRGPRRCLLVRAYDYARVSPRTLAKATAEAGRIYREIGVETEWLEDPRALPQARLSPGNSPPRRRPDLMVRILPNSIAKRFHPNPSIFGLAHHSRLNARGRLASVFFDRVADLAGTLGLDPAPLLGDVLAHEIGHLLLGRGSHAPVGLMRCPWGENELRLAVRGRLRFAPEQAPLVRARALERIQTPLSAKRAD